MTLSEERERKIRHHNTNDRVWTGRVVQEAVWLEACRIDLLAALDEARAEIAALKSKLAEQPSNGSAQRAMDAEPSSKKQKPF